MKITVSGQQVNVGAALQTYVQEELEKSVGKYFDRAVKADVKFSKQRHLFITELTVNEGTGTQVFIKSHAEEDEARKSFDQALERIEKQLRRYKRRIKNHHKARVEKGLAEVVAKKFVISGEEKEEESDEWNNGPLIVAEKPTAIEWLTVGEAVMRMDMLDLPALMFVNRLSNSIDVVYKRRDGNISWIASGMKQKEAGKVA